MSDEDDNIVYSSQAESQCMVDEDIYFKLPALQGSDKQSIGNQSVLHQNKDQSETRDSEHAVNVPPSLDNIPLPESQGQYIKNSMESEKCAVDTTLAQPGPAEEDHLCQAYHLKATLGSQDFDLHLTQSEVQQEHDSGNQGKPSVEKSVDEKDDAVSQQVADSEQEESPGLHAATESEDNHASAPLFRLEKPTLSHSDQDETTIPAEPSSIFQKAQKILGSPKHKSPQKIPSYSIQKGRLVDAYAGSDSTIDYTELEPRKTNPFQEINVVEETETDLNAVPETEQEVDATNIDDKSLLPKDPYEFQGTQSHQLVEKEACEIHTEQHAPTSESDREHPGVDPDTQVHQGQQFEADGTAGKPAINAAEEQTPEQPKATTSQGGTSGSLPGAQRVLYSVRIVSMYQETLDLVQEIIGGRVVRTEVVNEKRELLDRKTQSLEDVVGTPSPSRSVHSLTSGDMGDVSRSSSSKASFWLSPIDSVQLHTSSGSGRLSSGSAGTNISLKSSKNSEKHDKPMSAVRQLIKKPTFAGRSSEGSPRLGLLDGLLEKKDKRRKTYDSPRGTTRRISSLAAPLPMQPLGSQSRESEPLFSSEVEQTKTSDVGGIHSASLFTNTSAEESIPMFAKPPPVATRGHVSDVKPHTPDSTSEEAELGNIIPDSVPTRRQSKPDTVKAGKKKAPRKGKKHVPKEAMSEGELSPTIPVVHLQTHDLSSIMEESMHNAFPQMRAPCLIGSGSTLNQGEKVYARWKDKHVYPGVISHAEGTSKYSVKFEDGDVTTVKVQDIIVCNLLPVGQRVMATKDDWSVPATVTGHCELTGGETGYTVCFTGENEAQRVARDSVTLTQQQARVLMKELTKSNSESTPREVPYENYDAPAARLIRPGETLMKDAKVYAKWCDKHYYPGRIVNYDIMDSYLVAFDDGDQRSVKKCDIIVCDLLGIGQWVFAETESGSSETALIMGHYVRGGNTGYIMEFDGGRQERIGRSKVSTSLGQASTLLEFFQGNIASAADISLDNLVEGKRTREESPALQKSGKKKKVPTATLR